MDFLSALQVYLDRLTEKVSSSGGLAEEVVGEGESYLLSCVQQCVLVLARVSGCWDNYAILGPYAGTMTSSTVKLMNVLLDMVSLLLVLPLLPFFLPLNCSPPHDHR